LVNKHLEYRGFYLECMSLDDLILDL